MSYIEIKKRNGIEYASFVKKFRLIGKTYRIREYIGKNISTLNEKEYLKKNFERITRKEFEIRKSIIKDIDIAYNTSLLPEIELKAIQINNFLEIKEIKQPIFNEFAKEFIFNSNNIEGSKIPAKEVKKIIETGNTRYKNRNEIKEVFNSINALSYLQTGFKFNIPSIKRLYYILTHNLTMANGEPYPKGFKKVENIVNNQITVPPDKVAWALEDLLESYKTNKTKEYPIKLALDFHLKYENIHPFLDGNGRTGRLIMNKILMEHGYFPIIVYSKNSDAYFNAIASGLERETKKKYYQFMLQQTEKTYTEFTERIKKY